MSWWARLCHLGYRLCHGGLSYVMVGYRVCHGGLGYVMVGYGLCHGGLGYARMGYLGKLGWAGLRHDRLYADKKGE